MDFGKLKFDLEVGGIHMGRRDPIENGDFVEASHLFFKGFKKAVELHGVVIGKNHEIDFLLGGMRGCSQFFECMIGAF